LNSSFFIGLLVGVVWARVGRRFPRSSYGVARRRLSAPTRLGAR